MAHPHFEHAVTFGGGEVGNPLQQSGMAMGTHFGVAKFTAMAALDLATELIGHGLHAVANAQDRNPQLKDGLRGFVVHFIHAGMAAREDDAFEVPIGSKLPHPIAADIARMDFAIHVRFPNPAGNELGDLGAKVQNQKFCHVA